MNTKKKQQEIAFDLWLSFHFEQFSCFLLFTSVAFFFVPYIFPHRKKMWRRNVYINVLLLFFDIIKIVVNENGDNVIQYEWEYKWAFAVNPLSSFVTFIFFHIFWKVNALFIQTHTYWLTKENDFLWAENNNINIIIVYLTTVNEGRTRRSEWMNIGCNWQFVNYIWFSKDSDLLWRYH